MPYKTTPEADYDLINMYVDSFKKFGEEQAEKYFLEIESCFELLSETPLICRERTEFIPPVRVHHHGRHLIIYVVRENFILIVRVLHDRMDFPKHLPSVGDEHSSS